MKLRARKTTSIDSVRASRDGHEFHEAWTARKALQLLLPTDNLVGIAVEGLHPADQAKALPETVQIADIVLYYGERPTFKDADTVNIVQFKYSISSKDLDFRCGHAKETIAKFATAYLDHRNTYGPKEVQKKLEFDLITNRPIYPAFEQAIVCIVDKKPAVGEIKKQADHFKKACGLDGRALIEFASKFRVIGLAGNLTENKRNLSRTLVDWSAASDPMARVRLAGLKQLVRDKAGSAGQNKNVITVTDVLDALEVQEEQDLFPCPPSFPDVGAIVDREQLAEAIALIPKLNKPLLIHAAGGLGKTVFLQSLARATSNSHEVLLFDCFGGGAYRAPEDSRHLPKRGLIHIVNTLARRGLCDPLLPSGENLEELVKAFRRRLVQSVETLRRASADKQLVLFIDAIDNAAEHAKDRNEIPFPKLLLESFSYRGQVRGVKLVVSCRSHRIDISRGDVDCIEFTLKAFSRAETETYLRARLNKVSQTEISVAQARSGGNPRILEHLVSSDRGLLGKSEIGKTLDLDDLLRNRVNKALSDALARGYKKADTDAFLAGLAVLPPPVPLDEYAAVHGMDISAIESFAADLAPLLERTKYGLMFRDEPTETLIRRNYASDVAALRLVSRNLLARQDRSVYAARTLPGLLQTLDDSEELFKLAFDERFPQSIASTVGRRNIRYARLKAAVLHAAYKHDNNRLVHLLVELSTIAAVDQRGTDYILDYPDLVIAAHDLDATRRLFETRTNWPGTRHARLAIAHTLSGELDEAFRHAVRANEWIYHYRQHDRQQHGPERSGPDCLDIAAIPFCLIAQNRAKTAISFMRGWKDWYAYEIAEDLFYLLQQAKVTNSPSGHSFTAFLNNLTNDIGVIASLLSFVEIDNLQRKRLIKQLSTACRKRKTIEINARFHQERQYALLDGLLKTSAIAASLGLDTEALAISGSIPCERPSLWSFRDHFPDPQSVFPFLAIAALTSAVKKRDLREQDIVPKELVAICSGIQGARNGGEFRKKLAAKLESSVGSSRSQSADVAKTISHEQKYEAEHYINERLEPLLTLTKAFSRLLGAPVKKGDQAFLHLLDVWAETRKKRDRYSAKSQFDRFFQPLGCQVAIFALWARRDLKVASVRSFLDRLHEQEILGAPTLIQVVAILAKRSPFHAFAGEEALKAKALIEEENEVTYRGSLHAKLARAILPASPEEGVAYFKAGLEQMDAIGSGDYQFTNELLLFASSLKGNELTEQDFHTLTNICELNMPEDVEKFPWFAFAKGLSRTSGCRSLAKLSRWDDRSKVPLDYTLLPYLTALIEDDKIAPGDALALLRLSDPAEFYSCNTATLAEAIYRKSYPVFRNLIRELIHQFERNNPGVPSDSTLKTLASLAESVMGRESETALYLSTAHKHFEKVRDERNENMNYRGQLDARFARRAVSGEKATRARLNELAASTTPNDEESMAMAVEELNGMQHVYDLKGDFFATLRVKLLFADRAKYVQILSRLENLDIYTKLDELEKCKEEWGKSSAALTESYKTLGIPILQIHVEDFMSFDQLSGYQLKKVSHLSGVPIATLALELIKIVALPDRHVAASVWLGLASIICEQSDEGEGQAALSRLLNSNAAKLASSVADGEWKKELYPSNDPTEISAGLVWRMLGSPLAADRWRAAHSVRCFARFERWSVIDALVARIESKDAHPFQAPELPFYYLHARLWLLIALARIAKEDPKETARYRDPLRKIALDDKSPHVLMRHFAGQGILTCSDRGTLELSAEEKNQIRGVTLSPFPRLRKKLKEGRDDSFYHGRPGGTPKPEPEFYLDYDFEKYDVRSLADVFGKPSWEVKDLMAEIVHAYDARITSMYESGGREGGRWDRLGGMTSRYHSHGQQLGWHALFLAAGRLLLQHPVTEDSYENEPWAEWLKRRLLTRQDGLWLSDGMDRLPLETKINLLEKGKEGLVITGDKAKIMSLIGIDTASVKEIVVAGNWSSPDKIDVHVRSALVVRGKAKSLARALIEEEPFFVWLPVYEKYEHEEEYLRSDDEHYGAWIVCPFLDARLDKDDPLGATCAQTRPHFAGDIVKTFSLETEDPFNRIWKTSSGKPMAHSDAWGSENKYDDEPSYLGVRLTCSGELLRDVLSTRDADLLVLVKLQRYEKGIGSRESRFSHTIGVVRIKRTLDFEFYKGAVNKFHETKY